MHFRMEYKQYSYYRVISDDGELEPYIPWYYWIIRTSITFCIMLFMVLHISKIVHYNNHTFLRR